MSTEKKNSRLGKGLSALIGEYDALDELSGSETISAKAVDMLPMSAVKPNPGQPRKQFDETKLEELAASIKVHGVLTPILVREVDGKDHKYQIIAGERRWRASQKASQEFIPARVLKTNDLELLEIGLIENIQREDLNAVEEAEGYRALINRFGKTQESLADSLGKSRAHIANMLRLLRLPQSILDELRSGNITAGHARAVITTDNPEELISQVIAKNLSVRETERLVQRELMGEKPDSGSKKADASKDVDTEALEADLSRQLGLDVTISNGARGGEIRIKYARLEQLDEICRRLSRSS